MRELPTGTVTFLFSDIEGSTRMLAALGDRFTAVHADHQRLLRAAFAAHDGTEVSTEGDSFFVVFRSAARALQAGAAAQRTLADHAWPNGVDLRVRIGIHTGQGVLAGDNYIGLDVNRAARIMAAGHGGQVLLSDSVRELVARSLPPDLALRDLGRHRLRDIGTERLWQLDVAGLATDFDAPRTLEAHPSNLPIEVDPLIDRESDQAVLAGLIEVSPVTAVTGPGGMGKSRLAIHVAHDLLPAFPDGIFHLDLAPIEQIDDVVTGLIAILGAHPAAYRSAAEILLDHLRDRQPLIVLDNADRVPGLAHLAGRIAASCPRVRLLVTSRGSLHIAAEQELPLEPLRVGAPSLAAGPAAIEASPAVELFVRRARAVRPDFELTETTARVVAEICARLDGVPLAIELAAARTRILGPEALLGRLSRALPLLSGGSRDAPDRQQTMRDTIAWSYSLLAPVESAVLERLSVFAGAFDLTAAEAVAVSPGVPAGDILTILEGLVDRSLLATTRMDGEPRFRLLQTIREFARDELAASGKAAGARDAHARYWLSVARPSESALEGAQDIATIAVLEGGLDEFRAALDGAASDLRLELAASLGRFWYLTGRIDEGSRWLERELAENIDAPAEIRARALLWAGILLDERRQPAAAAARLEAALSLTRSLDDRRATGRILNSLGVVARSQGDPDRARALLTESLEIKRSLGDDRGIASTLGNLAILAADQDRLDESLRLFEQELQLDRASGARGSEATTLANLGDVKIRAGRSTEGVIDVLTAMSVIGELGDADLVAECLEHLGEAALLAGDGHRAARLLLAADGLRTREGSPRSPLAQRAIESRVHAALSNLDAASIAAIEAEVGALDVGSAVAFGMTLGDELRSAESTAVVG